MQFLIVDDEDSTRETLAGFCEMTWGAQVTEVATGRDAVELLQRPGQAFDCVIFDHGLDHGDSVISFLTASSPGVPLILIAGDSSGVPGVPESGQSLLVLRKPFRLDALDAAVSAGLRIPRPFRAHEGEFCRLKTRAVPRLGQMSPDVFLRISEEKYIKLRSAGDPLTAEDAERYARKKIQHLYVRRSDLEGALRVLSEKWAALVSSKQVSVGAGWGLNRQAFEVIQCVTEAFGFTEEGQNLARASVSLVLESLAERPELDDFLKKLKTQTDEFLRDHTVALTFLTCLLISLTSWDSANARFKLGLAAFLHDVTLNEAEARAFELDDPEQIVTESYLKHPGEAAALARTMSDLPLDVDLIISQHHERPDGSGFPGRLSSRKITPLSCVLIVAEDLLLYLMRSKDRKPSRELVQEFLTERASFYSTGYFEKLHKSMRSALQ